MGFENAGAVIDETLPEGLAEMGSTEEGFEFTEGTGGGGGFKPRVTPGVVTFRYEPTGFETKTNAAGAAINEITFTAHVQNAQLPAGRLLRDVGEAETAVRFCRVSDYKSPKMVEKKMQSGFEQLYECLGLKAEIGVPKSRSQFIEALRNAGGRVGQAALVWKAAKKIGDKTELYSTKPNTGRGEHPWPARGADGQLPVEITFSDGTTKMAREELDRLYAPKAAKSAN